MISVIVPLTNAAHIERKINDCEALSGIEHEVVFCYNGPDSGFGEVETIVERKGNPRVRLVKSTPFNKNIAIKAGLDVARYDRCLYTDVDCCFYGPIDVQGLVRDIRSDNVVSFIVLRSTSDSKLKVLRRVRELKFAGLRFLHQYYLCVRGGGYISGNVSSMIRPDILSDDLYYPLEFCDRHRANIVVSNSVTFAEDDNDKTPYVNKLPRLMFGAFQGFRLVKSMRAKVSILTQKLLKYFAVAFSPLIVAAILVSARVNIIVALALALIFSWVKRKYLIKTWQGIKCGLLDRKPEW